MPVSDSEINLKIDLRCSFKINTQTKITGTSIIKKFKDALAMIITIYYYALLVFFSV